MHWNHTNTRLSTTAILGPSIFKRDISETARAQLDNALTFLNNHLATNQFVAGTTTPTIADLFLIPELDQQKNECFGLVDMSRFEHILRYIATVAGAVESYQDYYTPVIQAAAGLKAPPPAPTEENKSGHIAICGKCGKGDAVIPIVRGRPGAELIEKAKAGLVHLGECGVGPAKGWCNACDDYVLEE